MKDSIRLTVAAVSTLLACTLGASTASAQMVSLTFDDGWESQYEEVTPLLETAGMDGTFYIISGFLGESEYMTESEVADLSAKGHEIGGHSVSHPHLPDLGSDEVADELSGSKADLESITGKAVNTFAYPYGEYYEGVDEQAKDAGYTTARTADDGFNDEDTDPYLLQAFTVEGDTSIDFVKDLIDEAKADGTWLIISFHHIDDSGNQYSIPAEYVAEVIDYLAASGVPEVTVSEGNAKLHGSTPEVPGDEDGTSTPPTDDDEGTSTPPVDNGEGTSTPPTDDDDEATTTPPTDDGGTPPTDDDDDDQGQNGDDDDDQGENDDEDDGGMGNHGHHHFSIENYRTEVRERINELRGRYHH